MTQSLLVPRKLEYMTVLMIPGVWAESEAACTGVRQLGDQFLHTEGSRADSVAHNPCSSTICMSPAGGISALRRITNNSFYNFAMRKYMEPKKISPKAIEVSLKINKKNNKNKIRHTIRDNLSSPDAFAEQAVLVHFCENLVARDFRTFFVAFQPKQRIGSDYFWWIRVPAISS